MTRDDVIEACSEAAHDAWFEEKVRRMMNLRLPLTWLSETGEEQLLRWERLSEPVRDFDRIVVGAILDVLEDHGLRDR